MGECKVREVRVGKFPHGRVETSPPKASELNGFRVSKVSTRPCGNEAWKGEWDTGVKVELASEWSGFKRVRLTASEWVSATRPCGNFSTQSQ